MRQNAALQILPQLALAIYRQRVQLRTEGATHKRVEVRSANRSARQLYSSLAFSLISVRAHYYAGDAALIMQLDFT